jgi:hypothetical protein
MVGVDSVSAPLASAPHTCSSVVPGAISDKDGELSYDQLELADDARSLLASSIPAIPSCVHPVLRCKPSPFPLTT